MTSGSQLPRRIGWLGSIALIVLLLAAVVWLVGDPADGVNAHDVHAWGPPRTKPMRDSRAAALVVAHRETVPANAKANSYVPTRAQLAAFRRARNTHGQRMIRFNPLTRYVTGRPGLHRPTTDELIQWVSHKWSIPTDLIRAQLAVESHWRQSHLGDLRTVPARWYGRYPPFARVADGDQVYQSVGIAQVKWTPDGAIGAGTEPLRWRSTAFSLDYYAATIRYYYDGACHWCTSGYSRGQEWNSVGAWFSPTPWANPEAQSYTGDVQRVLANRAWPGD